MKKTNINPEGFKNHMEAWQKADIDTPATMETLIRLNASHNLPFKTKNDVRFFVLMNHIRAIDAALNKSFHDTYLRRIQDNILRAGETFLP